MRCDPVVLWRSPRGGRADPAGQAGRVSLRRGRDGPAVAAAVRAQPRERQRVTEEVCQLRELEADLEAELTHARARALLAEVRAHAGAQQLCTVRGEMMV
jgi:hypothetical protein